MSQTKNGGDDFIVFGSPKIEQDEIDEVVDTLKSGWLGTGPKVQVFEKEFAAYKNSKYAVGLNSCTAALHLSILALGLEIGDEVITTPLTFCATINSIIHSGATPVLADVDPLTMNISPDDIERKITSKTKAVIPVHFAGRPCDMDSICALAEEYNLKIIEDCAHAIETEYHRSKAGTLGDLGCFSFYVTKNVVTGEGGMVVTENEMYVNRIKRLALHGMTNDAWKRFSDDGYKHYRVVEPGYKYNMMDIQAAIGIHQLRRVNINWEYRKKIWGFYKEAFSDLPVTLPAEEEFNTKHAYHLFTMLISDSQVKISRDEFLDKMTENKIGVGVHYLSAAEHPYYREKYGWKPEDTPNAMAIGRQTVSLPLSAKLSLSDVERVISIVRKILE